MANAKKKTVEVPQDDLTAAMEPVRLETELVTIPEPINPLVLFADQGAQPFIDIVQAKVSEFTLDINDPESRKEAKSLARKVSSSKTFLDAIGKNLVEPMKSQTKIVDNERKRARDTLDALRDNILEPIEAWEAKEQARIDGHIFKKNSIEALAVLPIDPSVEDLNNKVIMAKNLCEYGDVRGGSAQYDWQEFLEMATEARDKVIKFLEGLIPAAQKRADDAKLLADLKAEKEERDAQAERDRVAKEAADKAKADADAAAEKARTDAEARVKAEGERAAKAEADAAQARKDADQAKADSDKKAADAAAQATKDAEAKAQKAKDDEAAAAAKREADTKHRAKINNAALDAMVLALGEGFEEDQAKAIAKDILTAIVQKKVPHVTISY